ncbi:MAG: SDR family NAD(P)-dependent oxidoreductase, partial [Acidobacteriota bacterium]
MISSGKLAEKVAIITGSAAGIGRASCLLFAQQGAKVAAIDCDSEGNAKLVEEIRRAGGSAEALTADVALASEVDCAVQKILAKWQRVDILFNNAGIVPG